ncbi:hypothetical protein COTS27_00183 [Spirochaetota bacterium]|nr:hypothetical protein COTS27_00183 [Spirochaetota bacterium]
MKKDAMTHDPRYSNTSSSAAEDSDRKWKWALIGSFIFHLLCLVIVFLGAKQEEEVPAAAVIVEFSHILPASGSAAATAITGKTTQTQAKALTRQSSSPSNNRQTAKSVTKNNHVERKLSLIRRTKPQPSATSVQSKITTSQANLNPIPKATKELTLTRNNRYVNPTQSPQKSSQTANKVASAKSAHASNSWQSSSVARAQNTPGRSAKSAKKFTRSAAQGTGTSQNTHASGASSFNWNSGSKIRNLLATQEPPLPTAIRNQGIRAQAIIKFRVDKNGRVFNVSLIKNSGYNELDDWTVRYVRTFRFNRVTDNFVYEAQYTQFFKP